MSVRPKIPRDMGCEYHYSSVTVGIALVKLIVFMSDKRIHDNCNNNEWTE